MTPQFHIHNLSCSYDKAQCVETRRKTVSSCNRQNPRIVLHIEDLDIPRGGICFIVGKSGIGKSTILETLGMMNNTIVAADNTEFTFFASDGESYDLLELWEKGDRQLSRFRRQHFSFIFQFTNLMSNFTAFENVAVTRMLQGYDSSETFLRTHEVLESLSLAEITETDMATDLSGGQQQRLAFARAILPDFSVIFADEPTGNLDEDNAERALELLTTRLRNNNANSDDNNATAIIVTHDMHLATTFADTIVHLQDATDDHGRTYGLVNADSLFVPLDKDKTTWTNQRVTLGKRELMQWLKKVKK